MLYLTLRLFYNEQFHIDVCAEFVDYITGCNETTARWTRVCKDGSMIGQSCLCRVYGLISARVPALMDPQFEVEPACRVTD